MEESKNEGIEATDIQHPLKEENAQALDSAVLAYRTLTPLYKSAMEAHKFLGTDRTDTSTPTEIIATSSILKLVSITIEKKLSGSLVPGPQQHREASRQLDSILKPQSGEDKNSYMSRLIKFLADPLNKVL